MISAQKWLEQNYPREGVCIIAGELKGKIDNFGRKRNEIIKLSLTEKELEGKLDLSGFTNLEALWCWENKLTEIILPSNGKLKVLSCSNNLLKSLEYEKLTTLKVLEIFKNNLKGDIRLLKELKCLNRLVIGDNELTGSLASLKEMTNLEILDIRNTNISSGLEHLPESLKEFVWNTIFKNELSQLIPGEKLDKNNWKECWRDYRENEYNKRIGNSNNGRELVYSSNSDHYARRIRNSLSEIASSSPHYTSTRKSGRLSCLIRERDKEITKTLGKLLPAEESKISLIMELISANWEYIIALEKEEDDKTIFSKHKRCEESRKELKANLNARDFNIDVALKGYHRLLLEEIELEQHIEVRKNI